MKLFLNKNIYLVDGAKNAALYDLNTGKVYQVSEEAKHLIHIAIDEQNSSFTDRELKFLNDICKKGLLTGNFVKSHGIYDFFEKPKIDFIWIEITDICNLKCIHCYNGATFERGTIMPLDSFKHIIDEVEKNGIRKIQIIGGEPFVLKERLFEYLDYCIGKFEYLEIFTNGTLITDKWIQYLKENNIIVALSVYSYKEPEHNKVTQNSTSWRKTNKTIKKFRDAGIKYRVKNVIMKDVEIGESQTDLYELSHKKDIVRLTGRAKINLLSSELLKRKLITKEHFIERISEKQIKRYVSGHNCFSRRLYFSVNSDVYPCVMERRIKHGNLEGKSLQDILKNEILNFSKDKIDECKDCEFRYCCHDCRPDSNGRKINDKPWYCTYKPVEGIWESDLNNFIKQLYLLTQS